MAEYPTYQEALEAAAESAQEAYADSDDGSRAEAIGRAMAAHERVIADWDRNRPFFAAERTQEGRSA